MLAFQETLCQSTGESAVLPTAKIVIIPHKKTVAFKLARIGRGIFQTQSTSRRLMTIDARRRLRSVYSRATSDLANFSLRTSHWYAMFDLKPRRQVTTVDSHLHNFGEAVDRERTRSVWSTPLN
jgi:hypothetical protein